MLCVSVCEHVGIRETVCVYEREYVSIRETVCMCVSVCEREYV